MSREIKLRLWHRGEIFGYERLGKDGWESMCPFLNPDDGSERWTPGTFSQSISGKRDQFTGLQDKNGVDIYESDIVKHKTKNDDWDCLDDNSPIEIDALSVVEYKGHSFWLSKEYFGWEGEGLADWSQLEIIGNVWQHPHLINK